MLKEVGASGQISLGKKYAGQLFDLQTLEDGSIVMRPVKVVPVSHPVQEERATGDGWLTPERMARRAAAAARSPAEKEAARTQWEEAIEAFNARAKKIGSMARRIHEWRKAQQQAESDTKAA